jgi:hypothetical protein
VLTGRARGRPIADAGLDGVADGDCRRARLRGRPRGVLVYLRHANEVPLRASMERPAMSAASTVYLKPGQTKGDSDGTPTVHVLSANTPIRVVLDLPGESSPVNRLARISAVAPNGGRKIVWSTNDTVRSLPDRGGRKLTIEVNSSVLRTDDYIGEILTPDGRVWESYVLRVSGLH